MANDKRSTLGHESDDLARIHAGANRRKAMAYWIGFLRGVLASGSVERMELAPLRAEAAVFLRNLADDGAASLLEDLAGYGSDDTGRALEVVGCAESRRSRSFRLETRKDAVNELYGFCAGIACDNHITPEEVEKLLAKISATPELTEDARIRSLEFAARRSIADGRITSDEAEDICGWIARIVGDSCTDTGLPTFGNVGVIDGSLRDHSQVSFPDRMFVLTGKFTIGPRKVVASMVEERGGRWKNAVCTKTDYLVVAVAGSRDWVHSHEGTKILRAMEIRDRSGSLHLVEEPTFAAALRIGG